jgi:hypothetical protein
MLNRERVLDMERAGAESPPPPTTTRDALDTWVAALLSGTAAAASMDGGLPCRSC